MKRIIIIGQGRSGTTLIQRIINCAVPNSYIAGENKGFWMHIHEAYKSWCYIDGQEKLHAGIHSQDPYSYDENDLYKPCWWNLTDKETVMAEFGELFHILYYPDRNFRVFQEPAIGFKTIRFPETQKEFNEYIGFFKEMFPDIIFIATTRNINTVLKSGWWREKDRAKLLNQERLLTGCKQIDYHLPYEMMNLENIKSLFENMGLKYNEQKIIDVLSKDL